MFGNSNQSERYYQLSSRGLTTFAIMMMFAAEIDMGEGSLEEIQLSYSALKAAGVNDGILSRLKAAGVLVENRLKLNPITANNDRLGISQKNSQLGFQY